MSLAHRPGYISAKNKTLNYHNMNALFVKILSDLSLIKRGRRSGRKAVEIIGNIQQYMLQVHDLAMIKILGKEKLIRGNIIANRLWYSSRLVIISETEVNDIDSTRMSYKGFIGLFELEIINCMLRGYADTEFAKMSTAECRMYINKCKYSNEVDERIFSIIQILINNRKDDGLWVIINRNPSFDLGSIQTLRIVEVFRDAYKDVLTIPHNSLGEFTGDYDGDVLNVFSPKEKCVVEAFKEGFRPSKLILDRSGGYYNNKMSLIKDEYAFLKSFCDKEYKPIDPSKTMLRNLEDILKDIKDPFNYKKIEALTHLIRYNEAINDGTYFDYDNLHVYDPAIIKSEEPHKWIKDSYDPAIDSEDKLLSYNPFDFIDSEEYYDCNSTITNK